MSDNAIPWPNQDPVVDGITPFNEVPQSPDLFDGEDLSFLDDEDTGELDLTELEVDPQEETQ